MFEQKTPHPGPQKGQIIHAVAPAHSAQSAGWPRAAVPASGQGNAVSQRYEHGRGKLPVAAKGVARLPPGDTRRDQAMNCKGMPQVMQSRLVTTSVLAQYACADTQSAEDVFHCVTRHRSSGCRDLRAGWLGPTPPSRTT